MEEARKIHEKEKRLLEFIHEKEKRLLEFIRQLEHGEILIKVADGLPQMIERTTEKVKL